jgi:hypothetical protein
MPTAASQIWPHLPHDDERVAKQSKGSLGDALWPQLSKEAKQKEFWEARARAEQKAQSKRMVEHLRQINERLGREKR